MIELEHPDIRRAERTGYANTDGKFIMYCPVCGEELYPESTVYVAGGDIIGCTECVRVKAAEELM